MRPGLDLSSLIHRLLHKNKKLRNRLKYKKVLPWKQAKHDFPILKNFSDVASVWFLYVGQCFFHRVNEKPKSPHLKSTVKLKCEQVLSFSAVMITQLNKHTCYFCISTSVSFVYSASRYRQILMNKFYVHFLSIDKYFFYYQTVFITEHSKPNDFYCLDICFCLCLLSITEMKIRKALTLKSSVKLKMKTILFFCHSRSSSFCRTNILYLFLYSSPSTSTNLRNDSTQSVSRWYF